MNTTLEKISPIIVDGIVNPIVKYLLSKGITVTTQELLNALQVPVTIVAPPPIQVASSSSSGETISKARKRTVTDTDPDTHCKYVFTRKTKEYEKGQQCNKPCVMGQEFCPDCITRKIPSKKKEDLPAEKPAKKELQVEVVPLTDKPGFFREVNNNFYIQRMDNNQAMVLGVFDESDRIRTLTNEEKGIAFEKGFKVVETQE